MKEQTLYTFGYLASKSQRILSELIALRIPIIDIRYSPTSKRYEWTREALQAKLGTSYTWVQELGNEWYKEALTGKFTEPHVKLHNPNSGIAHLKNILDEYGKAAIMCACASKATCHRITVANLAAEMLGVKIIHL